MPPSSDEFAPNDRVKQDMALIGLEPLVQIGSLQPLIPNSDNCTRKALTEVYRFLESKA
jgi:hypothetical protein